MPEFRVISKENIKKTDYETIYRWRFKDYGEFFTTKFVPSINEHINYMTKELNNNNIKWYVLAEGKQLIACCSTERFVDKSGIVEYTLGRVMVDPKKRRQSLGSIIISECIKRILSKELKCKIKLEVLETNKSAIMLYQKMGFVVTNKDEVKIFMENNLR